MIKPWTPKGYTSYGADMGRRSTRPEEMAGKVHLERVRLIGDYEHGGVS